MNLHVLFAEDVSFERLLAVRAHEVLVLGVAGHVTPDRTVKFSESGSSLIAILPVSRILVLKIALIDWSLTKIQRPPTGATKSRR